MLCWMVKIFFVMTALMVLGFPVAVWSEDSTSPRIISNKAIASFTTSEGVPVVVESAPGGNLKPGIGKGTPHVIIVKEPQSNPLQTNEEKKDR